MSVTVESRTTRLNVTIGLVCSIGEVGGLMSKDGFLLISKDGMLLLGKNS